MPDEKYDQTELARILRSDDDATLNTRTSRLLINLNNARRNGTPEVIRGAEAFYKLALREIDRRRMHAGLP
jgi:hypothetical protein